MYTSWGSVTAGLQVHSPVSFPQHRTSSPRPSSRVHRVRGWGGMAVFHAGPVFQVTMLSLRQRLMSSKYTRIQQGAFSSDLVTPVFFFSLIRSSYLDSIESLFSLLLDAFGLIDGLGWPKILSGDNASLLGGNGPLGLEGSSGAPPLLRPSSTGGSHLLGWSIAGLKNWALFIFPSSSGSFCSARTTTWSSTLQTGLHHSCFGISSMDFMASFFHRHSPVRKFSGIINSQASLCLWLYPLHPDKINACRSSILICDWPALGSGEGLETFGLNHSDLAKSMQKMSLLDIEVIKVFCMPPNTTTMLSWTVAEWPAVGGGEYGKYACIQVFCSMSYTCNSSKRTSWCWKTDWLVHPPKSMRDLSSTTMLACALGVG